MSASGTLGQIAYHLVEAMQPLEDAFSDPDAFRVLLLQLGWDAPGLPPSYQTVADKVVQAASALEALADDAKLDEIVAVVEKAGDVYRAINALTEAPAGIDASSFLPELARRLFEYLLGRELLAQAPDWYATLEALGIISLEDHPATADRPGFARIRFDWDQIPAILSDPGLIPARVYGWGTPQLNFPKIAELMSELVLGLGLPASLDQLSDEVAASLQAGATGEPDKLPQIGMTLLLCDVPLPNGDVEPVGLLVAELPAEGGALPGMILLPRVPDGIADKVDLGGGWTFTVRAGSDLATQLGVVMRPDGVSVRYPGAPGQQLPSAGFGVALAYTADAPLILFGQANKTRLELASAGLTGAIDTKSGKLELKAGAALDGLALVIEPDDADSFLSSALGSEPRRVELGAAFGWSSRTGLDFTASGGFATSVFLHADVGPVRFDRVDLAVQFAAGPGTPGLQVQAGASFSGQLGPVAFSVDRFGVQLPVKFADGNAGPFSIGLEPLMPSGVGLAIDAAGVTGGGFLFFDPTHGQYGGVVLLNLDGGLTLTAIGLIDTHLPNGAQGFSFLVMITAAGFEPLPLGLGFTLTGVGGLLALNRTCNQDALRAGLQNDSLKTLLFPQDPIRNAPQLFGLLTAVFPPQPGSYLLGPAAQISWGTPALLTLDLALILELGTRTRLVIVGRLAALLPTQQEALVRLQMNALGVIDFDQKTASLDAALYDSRLLGFPLTGSMALRLNWGAAPSFALALGGFHPAFTPPPGFPSLQRLALSLSDSPHLRFRCDAYFALTANTFQFGAHAELVARAGDFSIAGQIGYDVLVQFDPFGFVADFDAAVQLKYGSSNLFMVKVAGELAGPRPLHVKGKATFSIFWCDFSVGFDETLVEGEKPPALEAVLVLPRLTSALNDVRNWGGALADGERRLVTLRAVQAGEQVPVHPLGRLGVQQKVVPLGVPIVRFGSARPADGSLFQITRLTVNGQTLAMGRVEDFFAPGQFLDLSDDDRLAAPSFERLGAGVQASAGGFGFPGNVGDVLADEGITFETVVIDPQHTPPAVEPEWRLSLAWLNREVRFGAAAQSGVRRSGTARYRVGGASKNRVVGKGWTVIGRADGSAQGVPGVGAGQVVSYAASYQGVQQVAAQQPQRARGLMLVRARPGS